MSAATHSEVSTPASISDVYRIVSAAEQRAYMDRRTRIEDMGFQLEFDAYNNLIRLTANGEVSDQFLSEGITALK
jgi:hypothetical protein